MKHAGTDYARIQDPEGKIGDDEPVMLFRAQDKYMPYVLTFYYFLLKNGDAGADICDAVFRHVKAVNEWQDQHGCKVPDFPAANPKRS